MKKISLLLVFVMLIGIIALTACGGSDKQESDVPKEEPAAEEPAAEEPAAEEPETEETAEQPEIDSEFVAINTILIRPAIIFYRECDYKLIAFCFKSKIMFARISIQRNSIMSCTIIFKHVCLVY